MACNETYSQIEKDINKFNFIDMDKSYEKIVKKFNQRYSYSLCHYVILDNEVNMLIYIKSYQNSSNRKRLKYYTHKLVLVSSWLDFPVSSDFFCQTLKTKFIQID
jgi:hypothetical protein